MGGEKTKRTRIILTKAGLDGHDSMIRVLRKYFIEQGFEVFYFGLYRKAADIAEIAIQEGVDYLGLSVHSGAHLEYIKEIFEHLKNRDALGIKLVVGGIISEEDKKILEEKFGASKVFVSGMPGTDLNSIREFFKSREINGSERITARIKEKGDFLVIWKRGLGLLISELANGTAEMSELVGHLPDVKTFPTFPSFSERKFLTLGVTGPLGVGKSSLTDKLVAELRKREKFVGVIAVDPSDSVSGGALLGRDRTQMWRHINDLGVHIYSMASRGCHGGVAEAVPAAIHAMALAGYDVVIVETIGVGQDQVEIKNIVDKTLLVLTPDVGEDQVYKSGLTQIADAYVISKSDLLDARPLETAINKMLDEKSVRAGDKTCPPVFKTSANKNENNGVLELIDFLLECSCGKNCSCKK